MYRVSPRLARALVPAVGATFLLSGCMTVGISGPAALGAGNHRSIKDDPEPATLAAPAPKQAPAKTAVVSPRPQPQPPRVAAPKPADVPTCTTDSECMAQLKAMIEDPSRSWIGKPQSPVQYAKGTRLFAYRALLKQLTCPQVAIALDELASAANTFRAPVPRVDAVQAKRVLALNAQVEQELEAERATRCLLRPGRD